VSVAAHVVALLGGVLMAVGPLLPWATAGLLTASGMQKTGDEAMILIVLGVAGALGPLASLSQRRDLAGWAPMVTGLIGGALTFFYFDRLQTQLSGNEFAQIGVGVYVTFLGAGLLVLAPALKTKPPTQSVGERGVGQRSPYPVTTVTGVATAQPPPAGRPCRMCGTGVGVGYVDGQPVCASCWPGAQG
jgi:hypothetical protein